MATKKNSSAKSPQATSRSNRDSMRWILGLLLLFAGLFLTASVLFYYFDWRADMSLVSGVEQEDPRLADLSDAIENPCGYAGAWLAERLVGRSFGLFGIILPLIVTMVGVRIIRQRPLLFNHSVLGALLILILGSLTLGFAFGEKWAVFGSGWGGAFGVEVARRLTSVIGVLGNIILLLGAWILTGVFINRNFINTVNTAGNAMVDKGGKIVDLVKQSVVNVADHRSKSGEEKTDAEPEPDSKPESEQPQPEPVPAPVDASARTSAADGVAEVTIQRPAPVAAPVSDEPDESPFLEIPLTEEAPATVVEPAPSRPAGPRIVGGDDVFTEVDLSGCEADAAFTAPRESEQPQYASEPAPVVDGITEYTLTAEPEIPAEGVVVTVEAREAKVVDEKSIESSLYDPLKDLNNYQRPPVTLLEDYTSDSQVSDEEIYENKSKIEQTLKDFGIPIQRIKATVGPTVTLYEIVQAQGKENDQWENPCEQETDQWGHLFNNLAGEFCTGFIKSFCTVRIIHQTGLVNLGFILIRENNLIAFNFNFANLFLLSHADESAVIDLFHAVLLNQRHNECIENNEDEQNDCIVVKPILFWSFDFIHNIRPPYNACF